MKIANLSVHKLHKLLGYLLLGIGAYALFNANNTNLQATAPVTQQQTPYNFLASVPTLNRNGVEIGWVPILLV